MKVQIPKKGFTLIELMVVVAILAILATIGLSSYSTSLRRARDSKRKTHLDQTQKALELYKHDNGVYPEELSELATFEYLKEIPEDPYLESGWVDYSYNKTGAVTYLLVACLENLNDSQQDAVNTCPEEKGVSYTVTQP